MTMPTPSLTSSRPGEPVSPDAEPLERGTGSSTPRRSRRSSHPGLSVLAHGEPLVWLTGGALVICLAMVLGLLLLVVAAGMSTFWPTALVRLERADGSVYLGEVTRRESFELNEAMLAGMSEPLAEAARRRLAGGETATARRRLLRTGNYELTSSHFHWVSDYEVQDESLPEWAVAVERVEWGRFYGEPQSFVVRHPRPVAEQERQRREMLDFFQANRWRLSEAEQQRLDTALEPLEAARRAEWRTQATEFLAKFEDTTADDVRVLLDGQSEPVPAEELAAGNVSEVREVWSDPAAAWRQFESHHREVRRRFRQRRDLEKHDLGHINRRLEDARLAVRNAELRHEVVLLPQTKELEQIETTLWGLEQARREAADRVALVERTQGADSPLTALARAIREQLAEELRQQAAAPRERQRELQEQLAKLPKAPRVRVEEYLQVQRAAREQRAEVQERIEALDERNARYELRMVTADGREKALSLNDVVRAYPANQLSLGDKLALYGGRWWEFLTDDPREANSEGGVFPAIWGTVAMTLIMCLVVVPFGVLAALYLREYARGGLVVSAVRIAINNLAGVPSIVFGVFGLGFFCYLVGGFVDSGPEGGGFSPWPPASWFTLVLSLAVVALAAFFLSFWSLARRGRPTGWQRWGGRAAGLLWLAATVLIVVLVAVNPYFEGFFRAGLPNPTFGKGGLMWASLTLALLTLPVVIVATEEALSAVPNSLREGSYAAGASKWQTIRRIILPHAAPGIMTGMILAMARGAGEVAPLMLVGAVKLAPELPIDGVAPFVHAHRSFMHLGFHIYDLGFQSQNSEAAKPMVFTTTLLLIALIALLNLFAVALRSRLRRRFQSSHF